MSNLVGITPTNVFIPNDDGSVVVRVTYGPWSDQDTYPKGDPNIDTLTNDPLSAASQALANQLAAKVLLRLVTTHIGAIAISTVDLSPLNGNNPNLTTALTQAAGSDPALLKGIAPLLTALQGASK